MAAEASIRVLLFASDGAASELSAQHMMDSASSPLPPLSYKYPLYGISLEAPVFEVTGPLISIQDAHHAGKTARNQPQHGTHTASLGIGYLVNHSLVDLYESQETGLHRRDIFNVDKQDDGDWRRTNHYDTLNATTTVNQPGVPEEEVTLKPNFEGTFAYLFILGELTFG